MMVTDDIIIGHRDRDRAGWSSYFGDKIDVADGKGQLREEKETKMTWYIYNFVPCMFILLIAFFICGISVVNFQYNPPKTTCQIGFLLTFELP